MTDDELNKVIKNDITRAQLLAVLNIKRVLIDWYSLHKDDLDAIMMEKFFHYITEEIGCLFKEMEVHL